METILLIYNDREFTDEVKSFLTEHGYRVEIVLDAELAEEVAEQQAPQLIVLDALLQKKNGFEVCKMLKQNPTFSHIPIIMTSAIYITAEDLRQGMHLGTTTYDILADRCLMKPFKLPDLLTQIRQLLGQEAEAQAVPKVLIVDDEEPIRSLLRTTLENRTYEVYEATTGEACMEFLSQTIPDVILLDYKLPDRLGIDILKQIRRKLPDFAVVILMTAYGNEDVAMHAIEEHVDGYLRKPFEIQTLLSILTNSIERSRMERERRQLIAQLRESNREVMDHYEMLQQANRDLRALDKLKSEFLANVGHELRTPLNSIIGFTDLVLQGYSGKLNPDQHRQLSTVLKSANQLLRVLNDVIEVSMLNAGQITLQREAIPISRVINEVLYEVRPWADKKHLTLVTDIETGLPKCRCCHEKVKLILYNLLDNAIKFSSSGEIKVAARATADLSQYHFHEFHHQVADSFGDNDRSQHFLVISVADQGIGISEENFEILFDEFRQVDGSLTREYNGTGLGLAISKKLVQLHGGNIWLKSQVGVGTTFYFSLPLSREEHNQPVRKAGVEG